MIEFVLISGRPFLRIWKRFFSVLFRSEKGSFSLASTQIPGGHFSNVVESAKKFFEFFACQGHPGPKMLTH